MVAVISEHEVAVFGDFVWAEVSSCFLGDEAVIQWDFRVVDVDFSICDLDFFSRESDEALDEELFFIVRIFENDDVKSLRVFYFLGYFIPEEIYVDTICQAKTEETVSGHNGFFH